MNAVRTLAILLALIFASPAIAQSSGSPVSEREEDLAASDGTAYVATSGMIRVPQFHSRKDDRARTLDLAFIRVRNPRAVGRPAHIVLAGGPGDSGVELVRQLVQRGGARLFELFGGDIIGIDQRGSGLSIPNLKVNAPYSLSLDRPGSPELWLPQIIEVDRSVAAAMRARGIDLEAYTTRESAADVNAARRALGYDKVVLWGRSYGSHLALAVLRQYPEGVERMILVGPEGPDHTWKLPSQVDQSLRLAGERLGDPNLADRARRVIARLEQAPVTVTLKDPRSGTEMTIAIGAFDVQWATSLALGNPTALATLPAAFRQMEEGDFSGVAPSILALRTRLGVESAMKRIMDLASGASASRRARIEQEARTAILGNAINFPGMQLQPAWSAPDLGEAFRAPVTADVPVLILAGDLDPRTPVANGREIAMTLPNAHLVTLENATHQFDLFGSPSLMGLVHRFLKGAPLAQSRIALPLAKPASNDRAALPKP